MSMDISLTNSHKFSFTHKAAELRGGRDVMPCSQTQLHVNQQVHVWLRSCDNRQEERDIKESSKERER